MATNVIVTSGEQNAFPPHRDHAQQPHPAQGYSSPPPPAYGDPDTSSVPDDALDHGIHRGGTAPYTSGMPVPETSGRSNLSGAPSAGGPTMPQPEPYAQDYAADQTLVPPSNVTTATGSTTGSTHSHANSAYSAVFSNIPSGIDLNTTAGIDKEVHIPAVFFGIPFPPALADAPARVPTPDDPKTAKRAEKQAEKAAKKEAKREARRPALLLYTPPRAPYRKPPPTEEGKPGKQKLVKRVERKWQEEVAEAQRIHEGQEPDAGRWKKFKAPIATKADQLIQWLPDSTMAALQRIPPKKRLKEAIVFVPMDPEFSSPEKQAELERQLQAERKDAIKRTWISGLLLPVTEAIDFFNPVPLFAFEVNLAYFAYQLQGLRKATALNSDDVSLTLEPNEHLEPLRARLAALCNAAQQRKFPTVPSASSEVPAVHVMAPTPDELGQDDDADIDNDTLWDTGVTPGRAGGRAMAEAIATAFRAAVPPEVAARHQLEDLDALAMDIERCLRKGVKEYLKTV